MDHQDETLPDLTLNEFSNRLASGSPPPGGGSAAAFAASMAAGLVSMVAKIILKKEQAPDRIAKLTAILKGAEELRTLLADLVQADANAFAPVAAAYRLPKETDEEKKARSTAVQHALIGACQTPIRTVEACVELLRLAQQTSGFGGSSIISDVETAIHLGYCALRSAFGNVRINLGGIRDADFVKSQLEKLEETVREGSNIYEKTLSDVNVRAGTKRLC